MPSFTSNVLNETTTIIPYHNMMLMKIIKGSTEQS